MGMALQQVNEAVRLPSLGSPLFATNKFSEARPYGEKITLPYELASHSIRSEFSLEHHRRSSEHIIFDQMNLDYFGRLDMAAPSIGDRYLLQLNVSGECLVKQGDSSYLARAGSMFVINPQTSSHKSWYNGFQQLMVWIDRSALERVLEREIGYEIDQPLIFEWPEPEEEQRICAFWQRLSNVLLQLKEADQRAFHWRYVREFEHLLLLDLLTSIPNNYMHQLDLSENLVAPYYVRRVERFLQSNFRDAVTMDDVYQASGVSPRTLFYGFRQFRRTTPMALLKKLRLEQARKELLISAREGGSVTETAINCGFQNMSMFSREYKIRFGEAPSDTLRRGIC
jgi:AraC-like DNA-binding protein